MIENILLPGRSAWRCAQLCRRRRQLLYLPCAGFDRNATVNAMQRYRRVTARFFGQRRGLTARARYRKASTIDLRRGESVGGYLGCVAALAYGAIHFSKMIPYLLLVATLPFTFGGTPAAWIRRDFK